MMRPDSRKGNNQKVDARNVFDETTRSEFKEWRSPNRILEVTIHKVCYPITEPVLLQIFGWFGKAEAVYVCTGVERVEAEVVFQSKVEAAEAYGELHGRNIYDGCCQMEIKWGRHNTPKSLSAEATPELPTAALATSSMRTVVNPSSEFATAQHVSAEDYTSSSNKLATTTTELFLASTTPSLPTTAAAPASISAPATSSAEDKATGDLPTRCSMTATASASTTAVITFMPTVVEFQNIHKHIKPPPVSMMAIAGKLSSISIDAQVELGEMH